MTIDYISDIHVDHHINETNMLNPKLHKRMDSLIEDYLQPKQGDVLIIAGDTSDYNEISIALMLKLKPFYREIFTVSSNHEMWLPSNNQQKKFKFNSYSKIQEMKELCKANSIHYLDGDVVEVDGIKIGGLGMTWDDSYFQWIQGYKPSKEEIKELFSDRMNDAKYIFGGQEHFNIPMGWGASKFHSTWKQDEFYEEQFAKLRAIQEVDIMVTHYPPIVPPNLAVRYQEDLSSTFYYFDGKAEVERLKPKVWISGHVHRRHKFMYGDTKMLANPLGYPDENNYNILKRIEI